MNRQVPESFAFVSASIAGNGSVTLVTGILTTMTYLYALFLKTETTSAVPRLSLQDSSGVVYWATDCPAIVTVALDFQGLAVTVGTGVRLNVVGAAAIFVDATLLYSQY